MTLAAATDAIKQAALTGSITDIYFEGGEPFLYYPILLDAARYARELKLDVGIVTNCYFAETVNDAICWLKPLRHIGVRSISISDDGFHGGDDPMYALPKNAAEAAKLLGFDHGTICIEPPSKKDNLHNPGEPILGGGVRFRGRAVEKLLNGGLPKKPWDVFTECPDEDWKDIGRLHLDPYGFLYPCQGVVVGNMNDKSLKETISDYDPENHPIIAPLMNGGPAELVREYKLNLKDEYHDPCHLCFLARKALIEKFPNHLAPKQVYF